jgi:hypothetical protein
MIGCILLCSVSDANDLFLVYHWNSTYYIANSGVYFLSFWLPFELLVAQYVVPRRWNLGAWSPHNPLLDISVDSQ